MGLVTELGYRPEQHVTPGLRNGAKVRCITDKDPFIDYGTTGVVTNTAPVKPMTPAQAYVYWDNDCKSRIAASDIEVIPVEPAEPKPAVA